MTDACLLAIDNGSQSTKVSVVDANGRVRASARRPLRPYAVPAPGRSVHPDDDLWDSVAEATREVLAGLDGSIRIECVGLCTIRFCRALLDADGELVEPVLSWMDERVSRPYVEDSRVARVTTSSGYLTHRLTGRFVDTAANYQGMWPIDAGTMRWSSDPAAYTATGLRPDLLVDLVDPGDLLGTVTPVAAERTGIAVGTPVFATANDKAVEALGAGLRPGRVQLSLGTYICAMAPASVGGPGAHHWVNFAARPGDYLLESEGIRRGMWTVSWLRDLLLPEERAGVAEEVLAAEAASVPPGSDGLVAVLDWLAPADEPHRRGALIGFDGSQGRGHLFRAVLEGIALTLADNVEAMAEETGLDVGEVLVTGGGAASDLMMRIVADVFAVPARRPEVTDAAGMGSAICAAVGAGVHPDWDAATAAMVRLDDPFTPDPAGVTAYRDVRHRHRAVVDGVADLLRRVAERG